MHKPLKVIIQEVKGQLEADDQQMARHLKMSVETYREIESGGRVLPLPSRKRLERRMKAMLETCGLEAGKWNI